MAEHAVSEQELANRIYIGPNKTGDNIDADRAANYTYAGNGTWVRSPTPLIDEAYDYIDFSNPDANGNYQTIQFNSGGSGGTTVRTLGLTFDGSSNVTTIARS